ncbi:class II fructose-bisphosphate aldolase [Acidithiobacillus ferrivorans]|uniref:class II fructose-bisphosphate aldolase n=1 Tax=Acidithiobacillus ferrivorans TaxID=160808 RepID=UPI000893FCAA|nr:class II fructose-bisphosphate aldolase [Acidithiobacillus ferrivorans]MBU2851799.1 fructose-bisphosphate aldolase [Acidithiobacillus ferrivorans]OFA15639.1 fructose-bisphosphate aldolase [Acidithiobacillus ferrivorans]
MPLVHMKDLLNHAYAHGYAVGAFDVVSLEFVEGVMAAAERSRAPVILSLAESHLEHYDFELLMSGVEAAARRSAVPVALHFDRGADLEAAVRAIRLGCNGVMVDASQSTFSDNLTHTKTVVEMAHACGVPVEGDLGYIPDAEDIDAQRRPATLPYTTVAEAKGFVERTGVDFLVVSIRAEQICPNGKAKLDIQRLRSINQALGIPLAIHCRTRLDDDQFRRLIVHGVAKINYFTALAEAANAAILARARSAPGAGYLDLVQDVGAAISAEAERCMRVWGAAGRAAEVLACCRPWAPVEHLIIHNVIGISEKEVTAMMIEGQQTLSSIPGVRSVITGKAMRERAQYRYCWRVRFAAPEVINSYHEHPDYVAFTNRRFRPVADREISIDYAMECL